MDSQNNDQDNILEEMRESEYQAAIIGLRMLGVIGVIIVIIVLSFKVTWQRRSNIMGTKMLVFCLVVIGLVHLFMIILICR